MHTQAPGVFCKLPGWDSNVQLAVWDPFPLSQPQLHDSLGVHILQMEKGEEGLIDSVADGQASFLLSPDPHIP